MKKISILVVSITLILALALIGKSPVKAKTDTYINTKIEANIPDSTNGNGCFLSFFEWFNSPDDYINFLKLDFNIVSQDFIQILLEGGKKAQNLGYIDENGTPCILYISSEELLNKWLRDSAYIEYGATYKDGITGVNLSNGLHYVKYGYDALYELLQLKGELQAYVLDPNDVPEVFCRKNAEASTYADSWYIFSDLKKSYVINNTWQYKVFEYEGPVEECPVIDLPNSVGKAKQISSNAYEYVYSEVFYNDEFGYYSLSQSDTKTIQLTKNQLPTFVFDSNGIVKDIYISKQSNLWTCPEVKDVSKEMKIKWTYKTKIPLNSNHTISGGSGLVYYEIFFNFNLPIDTLEYIKFNLPMKKNNKFLFWVTSVEEYNFFNMTIKRNDKGNVTQSDFYNWFLKNVANIDSTYSVIERGNFLIENDNYSFKIIYIDDNYAYYSGSNKKKWNNSVRSATIFDNKMFPDDKNDLIADVIYSYQSILYQAEGVIGEFVKPSDYPEDLTFWELVWKKIVELWGSGLFGKILIILVALLTLSPIIYIIVQLIKLLSRFLSYFKNKKSTSQ